MSQTQQGIGDVNGTAKGSGARYNGGKTPVHYLPITELARFYHFRSGEGDKPPTPAVHALYYLGAFQEGGDATPLLNILNILGRDGGIAESCRVFDYGAKKYAAHNWMRGMAWSAVIGCAARHLQAMIEQGEGSLDPESGEPHRGHALCNVWMLLLFLRNYREGDDRPPAELFSEPNGIPYYTPAPAAADTWPKVERRAPRPKDAELMLSAAKTLNSTLGWLPHDSALYREVIRHKDDLRVLAREGQDA